MKTKGFRISDEKEEIVDGKKANIMGAFLQAQDLIQYYQTRVLDFSLPTHSAHSAINDNQWD